MMPTTDQDTPTDTERQLVTIQKAMATVGVSRRTVYNWLQHDKIEYVRTAGGCVRIYADTLFRPHRKSAIDESGAA